MGGRLALPAYRIPGIVGPLNGPAWRETDRKALDDDEDPERLASGSLVMGMGVGSADLPVGVAGWKAGAAGARNVNGHDN
jgi:hypothetical protein